MTERDASTERGRAGSARTAGRIDVASVPSASPREAPSSPLSVACTVYHTRTSLLCSADTAAGSHRAASSPVEEMKSAGSWNRGSQSRSRRNMVAPRCSSDGIGPLGVAVEMAMDIAQDRRVLDPEAMTRAPDVDGALRTPVRRGAKRGRRCSLWRTARSCPRTVPLWPAWACGPRVRACCAHATP